MIPLWKYFIHLHNRRTSNGYGVNPIQYSEILAYFSLIDLTPHEWEIETICSLDNVALAAYAKEMEKQQAKVNKPKK